jgi:murein DD-endopeptidase MepM/ murein hydrolase activator NlpD
MQEIPSMAQLRSLRRSRSLTYLDLAALSGIPARAIAEAEFGIRPLNARQCAELAFVLGLNDARSLFGSAQATPTPTLSLNVQQALIALALAGSITVSASTVAQRAPELAASLNTVFSPTSKTSNLQNQGTTVLSALLGPTNDSRATSACDGNLQAAIQQSTSCAQGAAVVQSVAPLAGQAVAQSVALVSDTAALRAVLSAQQSDQLAPALLVAQLPAATAEPMPQPTVTPQPLFSMSAAGPRGCPLQPISGRVVLTQGYGVGTHAPAAIWGAVDLAIDSDGDGYAEAGASWYTPIVATHDGVVTVSMDSWPAGNHVWVRDSSSPWKTGYAHLAIVSVISGQYVSAGTMIGLVGSTGSSSGPHLDYQVWHGEQNIDPTNLVGC